MGKKGKKIKEQKRPRPIQGKLEKIREIYYNFVKYIEIQGNLRILMEN